MKVKSMPNSVRGSAVKRMALVLVRASVLSLWLGGGSVAVAEEAMPGKKGEGESGKPSAQQVVVDQVAALSEEQRVRLLELVNKGGDKELAALPGISATRATAIQAARPYASLVDLLKVPGIGPATLAKILKYDPAAAAAAGEMKAAAEGAAAPAGASGN